MDSFRRSFTRLRVKNPGGGTVRIPNSAPVRSIVVDPQGETIDEPDQLAGMILSLELTSKAFELEGGWNLELWSAFPVLTEGPIEVHFPSAASPDLELVLLHHQTIAPVPRRLVTRSEYVQPAQMEKMFKANRNFSCTAGTTTTLDDIKSDYTGWEVNKVAERVTPADLYVWCDGATATATDLVLEVWNENAVGTSREVKAVPFVLGLSGRCYALLESFGLQPLATSIRVRNTTGAPILVDYCVWGRFYT